MEVKFVQQGDVIVVHLSGRINFESVDPFRETCLTRLADQKVIFNFRDLSFVGSSGITPFIETISDLAQRNRESMRLCEVGSEFRRIIEASPAREVGFFENEVQAYYSFQVTPMPQILEEA